MARTAWYLREPQPQLLGWHVAAAADSDVAGRSRDGLARRLLLRYVDRRGGRAVDLKVRVARQGRELCGGLTPVAQQAGSGTFRVRLWLSLDSTGRRGAAARRPSWQSGPAAGVGGRGSQGQPLPAGHGQRLEVVDQAVVAAVQEKQCRTTPVRGALLEDVVVLQPVRPQRPPPARRCGARRP